MPAVIRRREIENTIQLLRQIEKYAEDGPTRAEAQRLADLWQAQIDPNNIVITD